MLEVKKIIGIIAGRSCSFGKEVTIPVGMNKSLEFLIVVDGKIIRNKSA